MMHDDHMSVQMCDKVWLCGIYSMFVTLLATLHAQSSIYFRILEVPYKYSKQGSKWANALYHW